MAYRSKPPIEQPVRDEKHAHQLAVALKAARIYSPDEVLAVVSDLERKRTDSEMMAGVRRQSHAMTRLAMSLICYTGMTLPEISAYICQTPQRVIDMRRLFRYGKDVQQQRTFLAEVREELERRYMP
jgi:hypothetical protein